MISLPVDFDVSLFVSENVTLCVVIVGIGVIFFTVRIIQKMLKHTGRAL